MRQLRLIGAALLGIVVATSYVAAQDFGATIVFTTDEMLVYEGTGEMMAETPTTEPITVGNFRILRVILPSESRLDYVGLVMPYRGMIDERAADLDTRWGARKGLALLCEVVDPMAPIGLRMRAQGHRRGDNAVWLDLMLAPGHTQIGRIPAVTQSHRYLGELHRWYVQTDLPTIYDSDDPGDTFSIVLKADGRAGFWLKRLEIKRWPTVLAGD